MGNAIFGIPLRYDLCLFYCIKRICNVKRMDFLSFIPEEDFFEFDTSFSDFCVELLLTTPLLCGIVLLKTFPTGAFDPTTAIILAEGEMSFVILPTLYTVATEPLCPTDNLIL